MAVDWTTFAEYLARVEASPLGLNVCSLVGHGTIRADVLGRSARPPEPTELKAMVRILEAALDEGALGLSSGLVYAPGVHAPSWELETLVEVVGRRNGLYATHMRNERAGLFDALDEAIGTARAGRGRAGLDGAGLGRVRLQVSHLKAGARSVWGRAPEAVERLELARRDGGVVGADSYPYTAGWTALATVLPPASVAGDIEDVVAGLRDPGGRRAIREAMDRGVPGWENIALDPGWSAIRISDSRSHPEWNGRPLVEIAEERGRDSFELTCELLASDRLATAIIHDCMSEDDVATINRVPWISVCTDAEGSRPDHPVVGVGVPHPRTYGTTSRLLGRYVREQGVLSLETAIAKMTGVAAGQLGLVDRGTLQEGALADLVIFDPSSVLDRATYERPHQYPLGIDHVIVNGRPAIAEGGETGARAGRAP